MLEIRDLTCSLDDTLVLRGIDLSVEQGEIVCLLGPSGCGKTTLLRVIAGLEQPAAGQVLVGERTIVPTPIHERDFGLMFQDFALFPHLNVADNVMFGLRMRRQPRQERQRRMRKALELVGLSGFERRDVSQLSGGERQRVALARSLAPNPRLLMLDEPLGSLDASLRERLAVELRAIIKQVGLTAIYVTHDQQEAFAISDRIAVMNAGRIEQVGTPEEIYRRPHSVFVARFLGLSNILEVEEITAEEVRTSIGGFSLNGMTDPRSLLIHPDGVSLAAGPAVGDFTGDIVERVFRGQAYRLRVRHTSGVTFTFMLPSGDGSIPAVGEPVTLCFSDEAVLPLW
jgi:thiamine transport system ATP-binding protein